MATETGERQARTNLGSGRDGGLARLRLIIGQWLRWLLAFAISCALMACDDLPRDPQRTLERVRADGEFNIGLSQGISTTTTPAARALIAHIEAHAGATARYERGDSELLLRRLEAGHGVDIVLGYFGNDNPWRGRVVFATPIARRHAPSGPPVLRAVTMNGENAWAAVIETASYQVQRAAR